MSNKADNDSPHDNNNDFAIKVLKSTANEDAIVDFQLELKYLAALTIRHPHSNIIRLHGISSSNTRTKKSSCLLFENQNDSFLINYGTCP